MDEYTGKVVMKTDIDEKRRFNRVPFSYSDNVTGTFIRQGRKEKFKAHILNFSMQGVYFTLDRESGGDLKEGDKLAFLEIKGLRNQDFILNIELTVARLGWHDRI